MTITTVGYGDYYPVTALGRFTAVFVMFAGFGIIGSLASIIASVLVPDTDGGGAPESAATPAKAPGLRGWVDLVFDSDVDRPALFGGSGGFYYNDVLQIDFATARWVEVEPYQKIVPPSGPPCGRDEHAVVFDQHNGYYWSFGGSGFACGSQTGTIAAGSTTTTKRKARQQESGADRLVVVGSPHPGQFYCPVGEPNPDILAPTVQQRRR